MFTTKSLTKAFKFTTHLELEVNLNKMKGEVNSRHQYEMFCYNQVICTSQSALLEIEDGGNFITSCSSWYICCCSCCNWSLVRMPFPWTYSSNTHESEFPEEVCVVCTQNKRRKEVLISMWGTALRGQDSVLHHVFGCSTHNLTSAAPKLCFLHYK